MNKSSLKVERYPGKMVGHLADRLLHRYGVEAESILDPYCGSGAILKASREFGIQKIAGLDINPYATLLSSVTLNGFYPKTALEKFEEMKKIVSYDKSSMCINWDMKNYWFTPLTLKKYEMLRNAANLLKLHQSKAGRAILLALAMSIRPCSRADQRSPKPFISKKAIITRKGKHFDPILKTEEILLNLCSHFGKIPNQQAKILCDNIVSYDCGDIFGNQFSHVITSPPYINAQDYFRNWKLELYILEDLIPFKVINIKTNFIGTECGDLLSDISEEQINYNIELAPQLTTLGKESPRHASIVHRYLNDMTKSISNINKLIKPDGHLILVFGDNLVGGLRFETSCIIERIATDQGFILFDRFKDKIKSRQLAPKRNGHKGLIKEEVIMAFRKNY